MSDNIYLMTNMSPWVAGVPSLWKPVLCGRPAHRVMVVPLNGCDLVLLWASFPKWGILFCEHTSSLFIRSTCS